MRKLPIFVLGYATRTEYFFNMKKNENLTSESRFVIEGILKELEMAQDINIKDEFAEEHFKDAKERILRLKNLSAKLRTHVVFPDLLNELTYFQILDELETAAELKEEEQETIEDQLEKSRERILRLKDLSMKLRMVNQFSGLEQKTDYQFKNLLGSAPETISPLLKNDPSNKIKQLEKQITELSGENIKLKNVIDFESRFSYEEKKKQLLPIDIYLDTEDAENIYLVYQAVLDFVTSVGFEQLMEFEAIKGSWFKRMVALSKDVITSQQVRDRLREAEYGIEVNAILMTQSEIDKNQSEALLNILKSVESIPNAAIRIGSLLVVKLTSQEGEVNVQVRSLSIKELQLLNKKPELLHKPSQILSALSREIGTDQPDQ